MLRARLTAPLLLLALLAACGDPGAEAPTVTGNTPGDDAMDPALASVTLTGDLVTNGVLEATVAWPKGAKAPPGAAIQYVWYVNGKAVAGEDQDSLDGSHFDKRDTVYAEATPVLDKQRGKAVKSNVVTIANSPPASGSATLAAGPFRVADDIPLDSVTGWSDADGDPEGYHYQWYIDDVPAVGENSAVLPAGVAVKGQSVKLMLVPFDGSSEGTALFTPAAVIANTLPAVADVSVGTGPFVETSTLAVAATTADPDAADTVSVTQVWYVAGAGAGTAATLTGASFSKNQWVWLIATPYDGTDYGTPVSAAAVRIVNSLPSIATAPLALDPVTTGVTITFSPGGITGWSDADGETPSYTYQWYVDGAAVADQTGTSLTGAFFEKGQVVKIRVTPIDGEGAGTPVFSNAVTIANTPPVVTVASLASAGDRLSRIYAINLTKTAGDADSTDTGGLSYEIAWYKNGSLVNGQTGTSLPAWTCLRGDQVYATVRAYDGTAYSNYRTTSLVTIVNAPPMVTDVTLSSAYYLPGNTAPLTVSYTAVDPDVEAVTVVIRWLKNGTPAPSYDDLTSIPYADLVNGDVWTATVGAHDDYDAAAGVTSAPEFVVISLFDPLVKTGPSLFDLTAIKSTATLNATYIADTLCPSSSAYRCRDVRFESPYPNGASSPLTTAAWVVVPASITKPLAALIYLHGSGGARDRDFGVTLQQLLAGYESFSARQVAVILISGPGSEGSNGPTIAQARSKVFPDPRENWDHLYAYVAMRTITYAGTVTGVNASYIGMMGVSAGGVATLLANGVDDRLAAAAPLSATGYYLEADRQGSWIDVPAGVPDPVTNAVERWLDPRAYLATQHAPVKMINGSQDEFFPLTSTRLTYDSLTVTKSIYMQPNYDHYQYYESGAGLYGTFYNTSALTNIGTAATAWMAKHLRGLTGVSFGGAPSAQSVQVAGGNVTVRATVPAATVIGLTTTVTLWASNDAGWTFSSFPMTLESGTTWVYTGTASGVWSDPASVAWFAVANDKVIGNDIDYRSTPPQLPAGYTQVIRPAP